MSDETRQNQEEIVVGVISDTHGLLVPTAAEALAGVSLIVHAGDIDYPEILQQLRKIAPTVAVRGNMDRGKWAQDLASTELVEVGEVSLYVLHDLTELDIVPAAAGVQVVIFGHSHRAETVNRNGVLFLNPGSAGSPRFNLPASLVRLHIQGTRLDVELIELTL